MKTIAILLALHLGLAAVVAQPVITNQPQDQTANAGATATYSVGATGTPPLTYQWRRYTNAISIAILAGETNATLMLTNVQTTSHRFGVVVTDGANLSTTSSPARLTVLPPPSITQQPVSQSVSLGASVRFSVAATSTHPPLQYQWRHAGTDLLNQTNTTLSVTNVQLVDAGEYDAVATDSVGSTASRVARLDVDPAFTKITTGEIVNDPGTWLRCVWGDFDNDGFLDLFVSDYGTNAFYRNNRDGTFTAITQGDPVQDASEHSGAAAGDFDNDGNLDLMVAVGPKAPSARRSNLYSGNGDGTFRRSSGGSVTNQTGFFNVCGWADYDNDGFIDLFVTNNGDPINSGGKNLLFHNNGDGTFAKITSGTIVNDIGVGMGMQWVDYDNDGFMDLMVVNIVDNAATFLYHNERDGTFKSITTGVLVTDRWSQGAISCAWGDYDNDGFQDVFITDVAGVRNRLYHNDGRGGFVSVASAPMLVPPIILDPSIGGGSMGCVWGDFDNDGYLDLFVASRFATNSLYRNNGDGTFTQIRTGSLANDGEQKLSCKACSWVDYDNDGFLDLFVTRTFVTPTATSNATPVLTANLLYHNNGNSNAWLEVKCIGTVANRSAIGAKVRVQALIGGKRFWQLRELNNGGGYSTVPLVAHFGLGDATSIERVRVEWPSGTVQEFQNVATRQILSITEPPRLATTKVEGLPQFNLKGGRGFQYQVEVSTNLVGWSSAGIVTITNLNGTEQIIVTNQPGSAHTFIRARQRN